MKRSTSYLLLSLIPLLIICISIYCKLSIGEYYAGGFYDPAYAYLLNALNLSQLSGYGVGHFDHPGTTVQTAGAMVIKLSYLFNKTDSDIAKDVLSRPEFYLSRINFTFILMTGAVLFVLGVAAYKKLNNIYAAFLLQLTPLYPPTVYDHFADVSSESLFIVAIILFIAVIMSFISSTDDNAKINFKYAVIFGIVCGFGLASKIIFIPLLIIPFLLIKQIKYKIFFISFTFIFFLIFVFPALSVENSARYVNWIKEIVSHSGKYGTGRESFIDTSSYLSNLKNIFLYDVSFTISYIIILITIAYGLFLKFKKQFKENKWFELLTGIFLSMTIQIILVAKHFDQRYMITVSMLSVIGLLAVYYNAQVYLPEMFTKKIFISVSVIIILFSFFHIIEIYSSYSGFAHNKDESKKITDFINENYKNEVLVNSNIINNQMYSLYFGTDWAGSQQKRYISIIQEQHPEYFYFDRYGKDFYMTNTVRLKNELFNKDRLIFQSDTDEMIEYFMNKLKTLIGNQNLNYKEVYSNSNNEKLYEIKLKP